MPDIIRKMFALSFIFAAQSVSGQELLVTNKSWDGSSLSYPKVGDVQMTAVKIKLKQNEQTQEHCHPVPVFGYMLSGMIEVKTSKGTSTTFNEGDVIVEVMNTVHAGKAIGGDAEILAIYAGSTDLPNTIINPESDAFRDYCVK